MNTNISVDFQICISVPLKQRSLFSIIDQIVVKLLPRLRLKFNYLKKHEVRHKFRDCVSTRDCVTVVLKSKQLNTFFCVTGANLPLFKNRPTPYASQSTRTLLNIYICNTNIWTHIFQKKMFT